MGKNGRKSMKSDNTTKYELEYLGKLNTK